MLFSSSLIICADDHRHFRRMGSGSNRRVGSNHVARAAGAGLPAKLRGRYTSPGVRMTVKEVVVPATAPLSLLPCAGLAPPLGVAAAVAGALWGPVFSWRRPAGLPPLGCALRGCPLSGWRCGGVDSRPSAACAYKRCVAARAVAGGHSAISLGLGGRVRCVSMSVCRNL